LDPTLLNPFFRLSFSEQEPYICVYGEHFDDCQINAIKSFASKSNYELVAFSWNHGWCDRFYDAQSAEDFQQGFAKSSYVMTSTFHGTIFAVVHHKPFMSFQAGFRSQKVTCLLESINLTDRIFKGKIVSDAIDYLQIDLNIAELRGESLDYLQNALNGCIQENKQ